MDIASARKTLGLSQAELAERLGVNQASISRFETGELIPNARTVLAIKALFAEQGKPFPVAA